jgi:hypothetical protein
VLGVLESLSAGYISSTYKDSIAFGLLILIMAVRPRAPRPPAMIANRERLAVGGTAVVLAAALGVTGNDYVLSVLNFIGIFAIAVMGW